VDGYLSLAVMKNRKIVGYDLFGVKEERASPFIRREGATNWEKVGPYFFVPEALEEAKRKILRHREDEFLIVDEVGPLEIEGRGIWPALQAVLWKPSLRCLLVVRGNIFEDFRNLMKGTPIKIFDIKRQDILGLLSEEIQKEGIVKEEKNLKRCPS